MVRVSFIFNFENQIEEILFAKLFNLSELSENS